MMHACVLFLSEIEAITLQINHECRHTQAKLPMCLQGGSCVVDIFGEATIMAALAEKYNISQKVGC